MVHSHKTIFSEVVNTHNRTEYTPWKQHAIITPRADFVHSGEAWQYFRNICAKYEIGGIYIIERPHKWIYAYMDAATQQEMVAAGYKSDTYVQTTQHIIAGNKKLS